jgi:small subunit ribosomal protein S2
MPIEIPSLEDLLKAGIHFGHRISKWHQKMEPYIFTVRNNVHIINLEKTRERLESALNFLEEVSARGGIILFVGTKKQAQEIVKKAAQNIGMPYVIEKWIGGAITNFNVVSRRIKKLKKMQEEKDKGEWVKYTKKEQLDLERELARLELLFGGISELTKLPDCLFIVDIKEEKTAIREASRKGLPTIAIVDTNTNPNLVTYPIPANDDAIKAIEFIVSLASTAILEGKKKRLEEVPASEK